jgi:NDP-sugar pyrophosphorylase family protein
MARAVVLAGGKGTRLRPYTTVLPKPLMPVGDRPILDIVVRQLKRAGFERVTMATGYLAELIEVFFRDGDKYGVSIDYFREQEPLGTVGALSMIDGLGDDDFLVMNGDVLTDIDYAALLREHIESGAAATIGSSSACSSSATATTAAG